MLFNDWIDPENDEHIAALKHLMSKGSFPEGFIPPEIEMGTHWLPSLLGMLAQRYLKEKEAPSSRLPWLSKADVRPADGQYVLFRTNKTGCSASDKIQCGYYENAPEGDKHWSKGKGPVWKTSSMWIADESVEAWVSLVGEYQNVQTN